MDKTITNAKEIAEETKELSAVEEQNIKPTLPAATMDELEGMELESIAADEKVPWRIADDACADWAIRKIAVERAELQRIKELACTEIARIEEKVAAAEKRCENGTRFLTSKLSEYFETVPHKATKTKESYRLLSGTLSLKLGGTQLKQNDEKLLDFLKKTGNTDMIKTEEKARWGDFKKRLQIVGSQVVDSETGEIVEGVEIITKPDVFTVDV